MIWEFALKEETVVLIDSRGCANNHPFLFNVCRDIRIEDAKIYYKHNRFRAIVNISCADGLMRWISSIRTSSVDHINELQIEFRFLDGDIANLARRETWYDCPGELEDSTRACANTVRDLRALGLAIGTVDVPKTALAKLQPWPAC